MGTLSAVIDDERMLKITKEFSRLGDRCYLDNAGTVLYPQCLLQDVTEDLANNIYMNPHSDKYTKDCVDQIRALILRHFNTDSSEYTVIFTSGTTQSLKLVVESFQFGCEDKEFNSGSFVYLQDSHTSVIGLRELAEDKNADIIHISHDDFIHSLKGENQSSISRKGNQKNGNTLVAYPAESNFNGYKYPLEGIERIKDGCLNSYIRKSLCKTNCSWYVLLDCAAYVPTNKLDFSRTKPDYVALSFYKMFGFPTGVGALLVKNESADVLGEKRYFGGGSVDIVLSSEDFHVKRSELHERFEDGTLPFLSILALKHSFETLHRMIPKIINNDLMDTINHHTFNLAKDLYKQLVNLRHANGRKAVVSYMDTDFSSMEEQGAIVTFNLLRDDGSFIGYAEFQHMADLFNISIRTGCFCNSGSCQRHLNLNNQHFKAMYKAGHKCGDEIDILNGTPTGAVRASFGYYNTFNDVDKLVQMICRCFIKNKYVKPQRKIVARVANIVSKPEIVYVERDRDYIEIYEEDDSISKAKEVLTEIAIYPVKSCGAFKVNNAWMIGAKGLEYDRDWMIVKDNGVCLTQKQNTRMCMIKPKIDLKRHLLILSFKGKDPISIPLDYRTENSYNVSACQSKVCTDIVNAYDCGDDVAQWISEALEISYLRLIRQSETDNRVQKSKNNNEEKTQLSLSNAAQYLLINRATVKWLSSKINDPLFMDDIDSLTDRFRGNIVVDMEEELVEREWQRVIIGKHEFKVDGPCARCQMICIDQKTGDKTVEPLRTISEEFGGKMKFGIYLSYIGTVDGSKDPLLKINSSVQPVVNDEDISR